MPNLALLRAPDPGLQMQVTSVEGKYTSESVQKGIIEKTAEVTNIELDALCEGKCGMIWKGYFNIAQSGGYRFYTESDDGSLLFLDGELVVNNDGDHGMEEKTGIANLQKGWHTVKIVYYNAGGGYGMKVRYAPLGGEIREITAEMMGH